MITFINHEADEKIKEMRIKAIQEYNTEKARIVKEETIKAENSFILKQKDIENKRIMAENSLMNAYRQKYLQRKVEILDDIYQEALDMCSRKPLDSSLVSQCIEKIDGKFIIYCNEKDRKTVEGQCNDAEIRNMVDGGVGGVILCSKDYSTIVDNSFASRMEIVKETFEAEISKIIFDYSSSKSLWETH